MSNTNRDYLIICDVKDSKLVTARQLNFYTTDKNTSNIFVKLVAKVTTEENVNKYVDIENASNYVVTMRVIKPNDERKTIIGHQHEPGSIFQFDLTSDFIDVPGPYMCELLISTTVTGRQELITTDPFNYQVKNSILSKIDGIVEAGPITTEMLFNELDATKAEIVSRVNDIKDRKYTRYPMPIQGKVFGHRGLNGFAPENTLVGIQTAYRHGYKSIEVDIHKTSDGNWILMHDGNVDRMTNGTGWVKDMTLSEIKALNIDAGNYLNRFNQVPIKVPTLEEALREIKKLDMTIMLEVKSDITSDEATNLVNIVKEEGCLDRVIFCSYLAPDRLNKLRGADKNVWLDYTPATFNSEAIEFMKSIYPCTVDLDGTASNTSITSQVALAQQNDIIALAWTVDDINRIKYLISLGVKSVITNRTFLGGVE